METIYCPECNTANRSGSNFCNRCGASLELELLDPMLINFTDSDVADSDVAGSDVADEETTDSDPLEFFDLDNQPWLRSVEIDEEDTDDMPPSVDELLSQELIDVEGDQEDDFLLQDPAATPRLIMGIQGLLEPLNIARDIEIETIREPRVSTALGTAPPLPLDPEHARQLRQLMSSEPMLADTPRQMKTPTRSSLRIPWLFALLGAVILLIILLRLPGPVGTPQEWPGVSAAYEAVDALPAGSNTLVYWAYDPSTAGEMDWIALPVIQHLLQKQSQLMIISPLPGGPATARRLMREALAGLVDVAQIEIDDKRPLWINGGYLPNSSATLPLLGQNLQAIPRSFPMNEEGVPATSIGTMDLAVVIAAQAEDVQLWLEQVAPRNRVPVLAFVGAGADPVLRPYWDSQQVSGLVSGFDGAHAYQAKLDTPLTKRTEEKLEQHVIAQNWGHFILLLAIVLGNLAALMGLKE